jgi:hypothetical protein
MNPSNNDVLKNQKVHSSEAENSQKINSRPCHFLFSTMSGGQFGTSKQNRNVGSFRLRAGKRLRARPIIGHNIIMAYYRKQNRNINVNVDPPIYLQQGKTIHPTRQKPDGACFALL